MNVMNSEIYAARKGRNWSRKERDLNEYLALEYRFQAISARSARRFLVGEGTVSSSRASTQLREKVARAGAMLPAILVLLHLRRPHRAGE